MYTYTNIKVKHKLLTKKSNVRHTTLKHSKKLLGRSLTTRCGVYFVCFQQHLLEGGRLFENSNLPTKTHNCWIFFNI